MLLKLLIGAVCGFLGAIGVGGGSVLLLYLTLFTAMPMQEAKTLNLLFFIPCALTGIVFHLKNKLIIWKEILPLIAFGVIGVFCGYWLNNHLTPFLLKKLFGAFVILLAVFQIVSIFKKNKNPAD